MKCIAAAFALFVLAATSAAAQGLRVVSAGPVGEVASLAEANEIRVVFSEPMVVVGRIPNPVTAPFFKIEPAVKGSFRWSGTTTLIFTPTPQLPFGTEYSVTIDRSARSVAGKTLDQPYAWSFTTPTIRLLSTDWYRKGGRFEAPIVIALRFNQPVDPKTIIQHLRLRTQKHTLESPVPPSKDAAAWEAKWKTAVAAAEANAKPIFAFQATDWDKERWPAGNSLVVIETKPNVPPDTWIEVLIDDKLAQSARHARSAREQTFTIQLDQTLFVQKLDCTGACEPDWRNPIYFRTAVPFANARKAITVTDITDAAKPVPLAPKKVTESYDYPSTSYGLDELGFSLQPARNYEVRVDASLTSDDGQKLGHAWTGVISNQHRSAFVSFGEGHGVWETSGGPILPFHARNFKNVKQWLAPVKPEELFPIMHQLRENNFSIEPPGATAQTRKLNTPIDRTTAVGLDLSPAIGKDNLGIAWAAIHPGETIPNSRHVYDEPRTIATLVQATNLGITVKDSPQNTVVMVTTLDTGKAVEGAKVTIRDRNNKVFWSGTTDTRGLAVARNTDLRRDKTQKYEDEWEYGWRALGQLHFVVIAEKDGDVAYVGSDWNDGVTPWEFGTPYDVMEADPQLRGTIFADRGVYKLGEEVHLKAIARADTPDGMKLLAPGAKIDLVIHDSHNQEVAKRTVDAGAWSSGEWALRLPLEAPLGTYTVFGTVKGHRGNITGNFLVAAYRRPDFRVDATLHSGTPIAGTKLAGRLTGRYLFGAPMSGKEVKWTYSKTRLYDVPQKIRDRFTAEQWTFIGWDWDSDDEDGGATQIAQDEETLDNNGELKKTLDTQLDAGVPYSYTLEGVVTDVTRQQIAGRASFRVEPAPWYIGFRSPSYFEEAKDGFDTEVVAAGLDGLAVAGVKVELELKRIQWTSVRKAEGHGFYEWETERKEVDAGKWTITTETKPVPLHVPLPEGGSYLLIATAKDGKGRSTVTKQSFYAIGEGYTAWERYDHNRIDLVPEKQTYRPGDTARIMIKSPWESATALLTTEREGVRSYTPFELTSTQQTITVPITEQDIPNLYVSVVLIKGRTKKDPDKDGSDPGKPAFRLGYTELYVVDDSKRLAMDVRANREEFRPASKAKIDVNVRDAANKPAQAEVTLWAVDYGVLSLTGYQTPEVIDDIYIRKMLQVANEDSRTRIVSRRVITPKGGGEGGGGGRDAGPGTLRKDFRVLAFWLGSLVTDAKGHASTEITLPESLTTYRIMAVAGDKQSRFGWAQAEVRVNKPLMLTPAWPRFLSVGDKAHFGAVVHNQLKSAGKATVTIESLDPQLLQITCHPERSEGSPDRQCAGDASASARVSMTAGGATEVRFDAVAKSAGDARIRMRVTMGRENDAFEDIIPVRVLVTPETVAAYGEAKPKAQETLEIPAGVAPGAGGLRVDLASTMMVGLAEGARYLVEYPYGCAEQRGSRALALMLIADLGEAFSLPEIDPAKEKATVQTSLDELKKFQCGDGGFSFWPGDCLGLSSPYLTSYVVHVFQRGRKLGYTVDTAMLDRAYVFLDAQLGQPQPPNEGWRPAYNAWQAFAIKVLAEGGRNVDSHLNRVYEYRERMPVFALTHLVDALVVKKETAGPRMTELKRRITNAILPEGGSAHVNELSDPHLLWFWNSNVRSTAMSIGTLTRLGQDEQLVKQMVRWLMRARKQGRWRNTQENAWAMEALVDYYRKYESESPDFIATVLLGSETIATAPFKGRSTEAVSKNWTMPQLQAKAPAGTKLPVAFNREGTGTLFYMLRLRYALNPLGLQPLDHGFRVERTYALQTGDATSTSFKAGDLIRVTLKIRNTKERRYVAITDPLPAGTEAVETWFATTASELVQAQQNVEAREWWERWQRGGFDHIERHDDRVNVFATRLGEGTHEFTYLVRATTAGTFITAPAYAEEMYEPEVFGRTGTVTVEVAK